MQEKLAAQQPGHPAPYILRRVELPAEYAHITGENHPLWDQSGEQPEWGLAIPWVYRALASPRTGEVMLSVPRPLRPDHSNFNHALAYWGALLNMLLYSLGWARPDKGLHWWYAAGKPVDDPRLQLLAEVWDADGQLDWFATWLWQYPRIQLVPMLDGAAGHSDGARLDVDPMWMGRMEEAAAAFGLGNPLHGGGDALHLTGHCWGPIEQPKGEALLLRTSSADRRAVLLLDSAVGWYRALIKAGDSLPDIGKQSWRVEVVIRPLGVLGTYRRSRVTGLWFAGGHRHHTLGV